MYSRMSKKLCLRFSPQRQNIRASRTLDFPDPLGPTMLVKLRKGPVKVYYSRCKGRITEGFEVFDEEMFKSGEMW